ncbi:hypothetical protein [Pseudomonas sp. W5-36]|uniref:hypothetical protein n=1 Tax=Pseudomonas sp. W5-36 TaxID=3097455 RepID=UPI00397CDEBA
MTMTVAFSDAELRRRAEDPAAVLMRDPRHPGLYFRFTEARPRGTWSLVVRKKWLRIGSYPELSAKAVLAALPETRQRLRPEASSPHSQMQQSIPRLLRFASTKRIWRPSRRCCNKMTRYATRYKS